MKRWVFCGGFITTVAIACSSKSPDQEYASAYASAICDSLGPCCVANSLLFDKSQCQLGGAGFVQSGNDAAKKAGGTFDQKSADDCVAAIRKLSMSCKTGGDDLAATVACKRVWVGTKMPGAACAASQECTAGAGYPVCFGAKDGMMGTCVVMTSGAKIGDVCFASGMPPATLADCYQSGLQCDALGSKTCIAQTAIGGACGALTTCASGAFCDSAQGKCAPQLVVGTACTTNEQCVTNGCLNGKCAANGLATSKPCSGS